MRRLAACLLVLACGAAAAADEAPFLWQVHAPGNGTTHYLLGSIHMLPPSAYPLPVGFDHAYAQAATLVFETDLQAITSARSMQAMMQAAAADAGGVRSEVGEALYERLQDYAGSRALTPGVCDAFRAWFCALSLQLTTFQQAGFLPQLGVDQHYFDRGRRDGKQLQWLEHPDRHLQLFTRMPPRLGTGLLVATLDAADQDEDSPELLLRIWQTHDVDALAGQTGDMQDSAAQAYEYLLAERNREWMPQLERLFRRERTVLVIVGAAHLVGPDGLLQMLRDRGFEPSRFEVRRGM